MISIKELRKFGFILSFLFMGLFGFLFPFLGDKNLPSWPFILSICILIPTLIQPTWLKIIHTPWMKLGHILGWMNTRILLGIIFFLLITPMGIIMRCRGKDPMQRTYDKSRTSYRKICQSQPPQHMEKPF